MKMVIVFDTEDREGMANTIKIVDQLAAQYMGHRLREAQKRTFGKIEFIKMLRKFMRESVKHLQDEEDNQVKDLNDMGNLRNAKRFADRIFMGER